MKKALFIFSISFVCSFSVTAQFSLFDTETEKSLTREGNTAYNNEQYGDAELSYRESIRKDEESDMFETVFNLGNALFAQERYEEAVEVYTQASKKAKDNKINKAKAFHNLGNAYLMMAVNSEKGEDLLKSIEGYKDALRINPRDVDTKYNLSLAMDLLKQAEQQEQEQNKQCDNPKEGEDGEKKEDQEKKENQEQQEQQDEQEKSEEQKSEEQKEQEEKEKQQQEGEKKEGEEEQKPQPNEEQENQEAPQDSTAMGQPEERELSREEMLRLLEALKNEELKVQEKLRNDKGRNISSDKDW